MGRSEKIGFLADTHSRLADGSDLPDGVLRAFEGVDAIVHLGDVGRKGIITRLGEVAPVYVPYGDNKGYVPALEPDATPVKVMASESLAVGLCFNIKLPDKQIDIDLETNAITWPDASVEAILLKRFKQPVQAVAFGGTHLLFEEVRDSVLFFNPGSPNMPSDGVGGVAVLDLSKNEPVVKLVRLT